MGEKNRGAGSKDLMVLSGTEREKGEREETNDEREDTKTVKMKRGMKFYRERKKKRGEDSFRLSQSHLVERQRTERHCLSPYMNYDSKALSL